MTREQFIAAAGDLLWPGHWRANFEDRFNLSPRAIRRMAKGEQKIPPGLVRDIETALRDRANAIDNILEAIDNLVATHPRGTAGLDPDCLRDDRDERHRLDPEKHGESEYDVEPGDDWYTLSDGVTEILKR